MVKKISRSRAKSLKRPKALKRKPDAHTATLVVTNRLGLHARAAALFVKTAGRFDSEVTIQKGRKKVNGKSIMGLLTLAAGRGSEITISTTGPDASEALDALRELIVSRFGEE